MKNKIIEAMDRMFDEACVEGSDYEPYFDCCISILFDKDTARLRLVLEDGSQQLYEIDIRRIEE
jgi:hypothetical protein